MLFRCIHWLVSQVVRKQRLSTTAPSQAAYPTLYNCILSTLLLSGVLLPAAVSAATPEERIVPATQSADDLSPVKQSSDRLKIGILYPRDGAISTYTAALQKAVIHISSQIRRDDRLPAVEFLSGELHEDQNANTRELRRLIGLGADALIAPNFLSALIIASQDDLEIVPLVSHAARTLDLTNSGNDSIYSVLEEHPVIIRTLQRLKFRGRLAEAVLMYDQADAFGRVGYEAIVTLLSAENVVFSTELFDAAKIDFEAKLKSIEAENQRATVIIVGSTEDVADVILQAQAETGLSGNVIGFIGDGNPAVYDLADRETSDLLSGVAWDVTPDSAVTNMVAAQQFANDRFAGSAYITVWTVLTGLGEEHVPNRGGVRNSFISHQGKHVESATAALAAWLYSGLRSTLDKSTDQLTLPQIGVLNGLAASDLE